MNRYRPAAGVAAVVWWPWRGPRDDYDTARRLARIEHQLGRIMPTVEAVQASLDKLTADVATWRGDIIAAIDELKRQVAAGDVPQSIQDSIDNLDAVVTAADRELPPPVTPPPPTF